MIPPIKWAGGKRALVPHLAQAFRDSECDRLIEPFAGSAAFFFDVMPDAAVLNDVSEPLMSFYKTLRDFPEPFCDAFEALIAEHPQPSDRAYYEVRERYNAHAQTWVQSAACFLYLNRFCFHGLWRLNAKGHMNVGYGHYKRPPVPSRKLLENVSVALARATLVCGDYGRVFTMVREGDFIFCDPPYYESFGGYTVDAFGIAEHTALEQKARDAAKQGATVVVSSRDAPEMRAIFSAERWHHIPVGVVQRIAPQNGIRHPEMIMVAR